MKLALFKRERIITTPQDAVIQTTEGSGSTETSVPTTTWDLSSHPRVLEAAHIKRWTRHGFGMSSVRFICGTQDIHKEHWKPKSPSSLHTEDTILYAAAFDANGGVFEPLLTAEDAIISDSLNHASIIDGVRLCKAATLPLCQQRHGGPRSATCKLLKAHVLKSSSPTGYSRWTDT